MALNGHGRPPKETVMSHCQVVSARISIWNSPCNPIWGGEC